MRHQKIDPRLFVENRQRLAGLLAPNSLAVVNANDVLPANADAVLPMQPNSDLFYLTGVEQEESILLLAPGAFDEKLREVLFLREPNEHLKTWEGHKLSKRRPPTLGHKEHQVALRVARRVPRADVRGRSRLPQQQRAQAGRRRGRDAGRALRRRLPGEVPAAPVPPARAADAPAPRRKNRYELELLRRAIDDHRPGLPPGGAFVKPGVTEYEIEAEFAHEFTRRRAKFAYNPIIAAGANACVLHYLANDQTCRKGDLLLLDVAASYANYNADLTRTIPVSGRFTRAPAAGLQRRAARHAGLDPGRDRRQAPPRLAEGIPGDDERGVAVAGLLKPRDVKKQTEDEPACRKYFMHGLGHPLGLDVHDVGYHDRAVRPRLGADRRAGHLHPRRGLRRPTGEQRPGDGGRPG